MEENSEVEWPAPLLVLCISLLRKNTNYYPPSPFLKTKEYTIFNCMYPELLWIINFPSELSHKTRFILWPNNLLTYGIWSRYQKSAFTIWIQQHIHFEWYKVTLQTPGNPHLTPCYLGSSEHNTRGRIILGLPTDACRCQGNMI